MVLRVSMFIVYNLLLLLTMENSKKEPKLGDIVKVYYKEKRIKPGCAAEPNHEFGVVVKTGEEKIHLLKINKEYELSEVNWFLEHNKIKFVYNEKKRV